MSQFDETTSFSSDVLRSELARDVLQSSGVLRLQATGWSMLPTLWPGDTLVIERLACDDISTGDIVFYGRGERLFAHRVLSAGHAGNAIITRGDGMHSADPPVPASEVLGRVCLVIRDGKYIKPAANLSLMKSILAAIIRRSVFASRILVHLHSTRATSGEQVIPCQN